MKMKLRGLISKRYKQLSARKTSNMVKMWAKDLSRRFSKEDMHMANEHEKMLSVIHY